MRPRAIGTSELELYPRQPKFQFESTGTLALNGFEEFARSIGIILRGKKTHSHSDPRLTPPRLELKTSFEELPRGVQTTLSFTPCRQIHRRNNEGQAEPARRDRIRIRMSRDLFGALIDPIGAPGKGIREHEPCQRRWVVRTIAKCALEVLRREEGTTEIESKVGQAVSCHHRRNTLEFEIGQLEAAQLKSIDAVPFLFEVRVDSCGQLAAFSKRAGCLEKLTRLI